MRPRPAWPRLAGWPEALVAAIEAARHRPFAWGEHDCAIMAADVVRAITGRDWYEDWRGTYATEEALAARVEPFGGVEGALASVMAAFGAQEIDPAFAQRGDVVLVHIGNEEMVGIALDDRVAVAGLDGLGFAPRRMARRAWAV